MKRKEVTLISLIVIVAIFLIIFVKADSQLFIPSGGDNQLSIGGGGASGDSQFSFWGIPVSSTETSSGSSTGGTGTTTGTGSGSGSGGGSGSIILGPSTGTSSTINLTITPAIINVNLPIGEKIEQQISVTNKLSSSVNLSINQENLTQLVLLRNDSISLAPGQTKNFSVAFIDDNKTGLFTGKIIIGGNEIPVNLNIIKKKLLFDVSVNILNMNSQITRWGKLKTDVTMIPRGANSRLDVQLDYLIKSQKGNILINKTEEVLIDSNETIKKDFSIGSLSEGNYTLEVILNYPGGVASSSSNFEVTKLTVIGETMYYALFGLVASSVIMIIILLGISARKKDKPEDEEKFRQALMTIQRVSGY